MFERQKETQNTALNPLEAMKKDSARLKDFPHILQTDVPVERGRQFISVIFFHVCFFILRIVPGDHLHFETPFNIYKAFTFDFILPQ